MATSRTCPGQSANALTTGWTASSSVARPLTALSAWLFAIYVGQAKRLALNPPDSAWGRQMLLSVAG